jgi:hypothetical protein
MWSLTKVVPRFGLLALVTTAALCFQAPAFATGTRTVADRVMDGTGVAVGVGIDESQANPDLARFDTTVPHNFSLLCDVPATAPIPAGRPYYPDFLEITWNDLRGDTFTFKLRKLTFSQCTKPTMFPSFICDPFIVDDCFDTIVGRGTGSITTTGPNAASFPSCSDCGEVDFNFTDNGPPKTGSLTQTPPYDQGSFTVSRRVSASVSNGILFGCTDCPLSKADYRARQRGTCNFS